MQTGLERERVEEPVDPFEPRVGRDRNGERSVGGNAECTADRTVVTAHIRLVSIVVQDERKYGASGRIEIVSRRVSVPLARGQKENPGLWRSREYARFKCHAGAIARCPGPVSGRRIVGRIEEICAGDERRTELAERLRCAMLALANARARAWLVIAGAASRVAKQPVMVVALVDVVTISTLWPAALR